MAIKPIQRFGKFTAPRPDQSGEIRMRALAGLGKDISSLGRSYAQVKASERREEEKVQAEADILLKQQEANRVRLDHDAHLRELVEAHKDDPTQFLANATAYTNATFEGIDPEVRAKVEVDLTEKYRTIHSNLLDKFNANVVRKGKQTNQNAIDSLFVDLDNAIRNNQDITSIQQSLNDAITNAGKLDPTVNVAQKQNELNKHIAYKQIEAPILKVADTDANSALAMYDDALNNIPDGYTQDEWKSTLDSTLTQINTQSGLQANQKKIKLKENTKLVSNVVSSLNGGADINAQVLADAEIAAIDIGKLDEFNLAKQMNQYSRSDLNTQTALRQNALQDPIKNEPLLKGMKQADIARLKKLKESALDWGAGVLKASNGSPVIERVQFESLMFPTQEELTQRQANIEIVKNYTGFHDIHLFTAQEKTAFVETLKQLNPTEMLGVVNAYGRNSYIQNIVAQEMGDGVTAHAFDKPQIASVLFEGKLRAQSKPPIAALQGNAKANAYGKFTEHTGTDIDSVNYGHYLAAVEAYYLGSVDVGTGITAEETSDGALKYDFNENKWEEAIQAVVGNTMEFRDKKIILGSHTEEQLNDMVDYLTEDNIQLLTNTQGDTYITEDEAGDILSLIQNENRTRLQKIAGIDGEEGNYQVMRVVEINGVEQENILVSKSGQPVILQLNNDALNKNIQSFLSTEEGAKISRRVELDRQLKTKPTNPFGMN
jgi:hypothetical protein